jgi:hypothetical protein
VDAACPPARFATARGAVRGSAPRHADRGRPWRVVLLAWALAGLAWAQPNVPWPDFPLDDLRPGVVGHGLTEGPAGVVRFEVEVLGRQDAFGLGFPLILVRVSGPVVDEGGGVSAGMSGSPVLVPHDGHDALLGAIGYTFPASPAQLALVTPIGAMRQQAGPRRTAATTFAGDDAAAAEAVAPGAVPIATPVLVAGLGERAMALLQRDLLATAALPVQAIQGGGGSGTNDRPLTAGSSVAAAWLLGDVRAAVVGTVTTIEGADLLAFGHPVLGGGPVDWPLLPAPVVAVVPSRTLPFKLTNIGAAVLGRVDQDRPAGVGARLGATPAMLPVTLTVATDERTTTLRFEVVRDPRLWPTLVAVATLEGIDRARARSGEGTATVHWDVALGTGPALRLVETVVDAGDVGTAAALLARAPLALLTGNPFQEPGIERLSLLVRLEERRRDIEVRRVVTAPGDVVAGRVTPLYLSLQPWRGAGVVRAVDVRWPDDLAGRVEVVVRGGAWPRDPDAEEPPDPEDAPLTYDELLAFLRERPGGGDLVIEARAEGGSSWRRLERLELSGFVTGRATLWLEVDTPAGPEHGAGEEGP